MSVRRDMPQLVLVVKWRAAVTSEMVIRQAIRRLIDARLPATWSLEDAAQAESLQSWGATRFGADAALMLEGEMLPESRNDAALPWARRVKRRLQQIRSVGVAAESLHARRADAASMSLQYLGGVGVRAVVAEVVGPPVRSLPLGMWQFAPRVALPQTVRWWQWLRRQPRLVSGADSASRGVVTLDLSLVESLGANAWRSCDKALAELAEARGRGEVAVGTIGEMAAALSASHAVKPQRSILRAAA